MKVKDIFFYSLGCLVVLGFFSVLTGLIITNQAPDTINLMLGALVGAFGTVVGYFYGSSASSARKDETINNLKNTQ